MDLAAIRAQLRNEESTEALTAPALQRMVAETYERGYWGMVEHLKRIGLSHEDAMLAVDALVRCR